MPISLLRCSTRYRQHTEEPRYGQQQRETAQHERHPERDLQEERLEPCQRAHGHDHAQVLIDPGQAIDESTLGKRGITLHARRDRRLRHVDAGRQEDAGLPGVDDPKTRHVVRDAHHRDQPRRHRRFVLRPRSGTGILLEPERSADAAAIRPELPRDRFRDDGDRLLAVALRRREGPPAHNVRTGRDVPRSGVCTNPLRAQRSEMVGQCLEFRRHDG